MRLLALSQENNEKPSGSGVRERPERRRLLEGLGVGRGGGVGGES